MCFHFADLLTCIKGSKLYAQCNNHICLKCKTLRTSTIFSSVYTFSISSCVQKYVTFKYLGSLLTNQNSVHEEIKCRLKGGNSSHYSVQTLLSSRLLLKNLKIKIYKIIMSILYDCEIQVLTLREEYRLKVFESRILRQMANICV